MKIETEIQKIKTRNEKVELDKAWETSWSKKVIIACLTYAVILSFFFVIEVKNPFKNALVPTFGFLLSTLSLNFFKQFWLKNIHKK